MPEASLNGFRLAAAAAVVVGLQIASPGCAPTAAVDSDRIQPWLENPSYWQYKGEPVLLLGGTDDDNLFQWEDPRLREQLDTLKAAGGNYVRNTMSDRPGIGHEVYPFARTADGKYNLNEWNTEYWRRFERFLQWTGERDIIVQIEVWDRFDQSRGPWLTHPFHPGNNVNFSYEESGFEAEYPDHPGQNKQPFFSTTPQQRNNETVLRYQQRFVDKMLSYSLQFGHVLYCVDNETSGEEEWGRYWAQYIKSASDEQGVRVNVTEMWDAWDIKADEHRRTFDHPELYDFVDVSQNNHNTGEQHWENAVWARQYFAGRPRPINTVKTYGADTGRFGTSADGVERFWRHILAGLASARFHRPDSGLGLSATAQASIGAARKAESLVPFWELEPANQLLSDREPNEAYLAAAPGTAYALYFTNGGSVSLALESGDYDLRWISADTGEWGEQSGLSGGGEPLQIEAPGEGPWVAAILRR